MTRCLKGFSLIEVLVAAAILSGAVVTICALSVRSLEALRIHQEYERAWDVLERQLVLIDQIGITSFASNPQMSGVIDDASSGKKWQWRLEVEKQLIAELYDVKMSLQWESDGRMRQIRCDTRMRSAEEIEPSNYGKTTETADTTGTSTPAQ